MRTTPDTLARIDPRSLEVTDIYPMIEGIRTLVASLTDIWVVHRNNRPSGASTPSPGSVTRRVAVGETEAGAAAYGAGAVWVTSPQEDTRRAHRRQDAGARSRAASAAARPASPPAGGRSG